MGLDVSSNQLTGSIPSAVAARIPVTASSWINNCLVNTTTRYATCDASARSVLVDVYESALGSGWLTATNWLSGTIPPCSWAGVGCVNSVVVSLSLAGNGLGGTLSTSLGLLTAMT